MVRPRPYCTDTADKSVFLAHKKSRFRVVLNGAPQAILYGYGGQVRFLGAQKTTLSRGFKWCAQQEAYYTTSVLDEIYLVCLFYLVSILIIYILFCFVYYFLWVELDKSTTLSTTLFISSKRLTASCNVSGIRWAYI